jgi:hypothetical protein
MSKTLEQRLYDGNRAREVLENEVFQQVFVDIELEVIESWKNSPVRDQEGREKIWQYLTLLKKVQSHLTTTLETGKLAQLELQHKQSLFDRAKAGISSMSGSGT